MKKELTSDQQFEVEINKAVKAIKKVNSILPKIDVSNDTIKLGFGYLKMVLEAQEQRALKEAVVEKPFNVNINPDFIMGFQNAPIEPEIIIHSRRRPSRPQSVDNVVDGISFIEE